MVDRKIERLPKTMQQLLLSHPFPVNQGPLITALDTNTEGKKSVAEVMKARTVFSHSGFPRSGARMHGLVNKVKAAIR
jgi:hypothetical protein